MVSPPISGITLCLLVAAVLLALVSPWAGFILALGCAAFEFILLGGPGGGRGLG